jgi:hypothetical protein
MSYRLPPPPFPWLLASVEALEATPDHELSLAAWAALLLDAMPGVYGWPAAVGRPSRDTLPGTPGRVDAYACRAALALAVFCAGDLTHAELAEQVEQAVARGRNGAAVAGDFRAHRVPDFDADEVADERAADLVFRPRPPRVKTASAQTAG